LYDAEQLLVIVVILPGAARMRNTVPGALSSNPSGVVYQGSCDGGRGVSEELALELHDEARSDIVAASNPGARSVATTSRRMTRDDMILKDESN
jgi:hypothetical protein